MTMQDFITKYGTAVAEVMLRRFSERDAFDTLRGRIFYSLLETEQEFLKSIPKGNIIYLTEELKWSLIDKPTWHGAIVYAPAPSYTLPKAVEYFIGNRDGATYLTPLGLKDHVASLTHIMHQYWGFFGWTNNANFQGGEGTDSQSYGWDEDSGCAVPYEYAVWKKL